MEIIKAPAIDDPSRRDIAFSKAIVTHTPTIPHIFSMCILSHIQHPFIESSPCNIWVTMESIIDNSQVSVLPDTDFIDGKRSALHILFESYLELQIKGVHYLSIEELLQTIRTLILNLERSDLSWRMRDYEDGWLSVLWRTFQRTNWRFLMWNDM